MCFYGEVGLIPEMMTKSGLSVDVESLHRMVAIRLLLACRPVRSANRLVCGLLKSLTPLTQLLVGDLQGTMHF